MPNKASWINLKTSKLSLLFYGSSYSLILGLLLSHANPLAQGLALIVAVQGGLTAYFTYGPTAPKALKPTTNQQLNALLKNGRLIRLQPPLLVQSRYLIVFRPWRAWGWPWLLWPDALTKQEHHRLRFFLASWQTPPSPQIRS